MEIKKKGEITGKIDEIGARMLRRNNNYDVYVSYFSLIYFNTALLSLFMAI